MIGSFVLFANRLLFQSTTEGLNAIECQSASRSYLFICLTLAALCAIFGVALKWWLDRGHRLGTPNFRLWLTVVLVVATASIIIAVEPGIITSEFLQGCRDDPEWSRYVVMANSSKLSKGLILGGAPSLLIYFVAHILRGAVAHQFKRRS
jgi:hypothetical protein